MRWRHKASGQLYTTVRDQVELCDDERNTFIITSQQLADNFEQVAADATPAPALPSPQPNAQPGP